jgi:hypothetical protein
MDAVVDIIPVIGHCTSRLVPPVAAKSAQGMDYKILKQLFPFMVMLDPSHPNEKSRGGLVDRLGAGTQKQLRHFLFGLKGDGRNEECFALVPAVVGAEADGQTSPVRVVLATL